MVGTESVEEFPDRLFGLEYVPARVLPVSGNDRLLAFEFRASVPPDDRDEAPFIA
jgi:hypothetical protein